MRQTRKPASRKQTNKRRRIARLHRIESLEPRQLLNAAPVANDDSYTVAEDSVLSGAISTLANDTDADNDVLTAALVGGPSNGTLSLKLDGTFTYTPNFNFSGTDTFTYAAVDGKGGEDNATVTIDVIGENEPPNVNNQIFSVAENSANGTAVGKVVATDPDAGDVLTFTWSDSSGAFAIDSTGRITVADGSKIDFETKPTINLSVSASDIQGASDTATITINVSDANDAPTIAAPLADLTVAEESSPTVINVSGVFVDQDLDPILFQVASDNPALVTPSLSGSELKLAYNINQFGSAKITLTAHDGKGGTTSETFFVNVTNVNDPPEAIDDAFSMLAGTSITANVLANDADPDGDTLSAFLSSATSNGTLSFQSNGTFTYTPTAKFSGADSFTYTASDGKGTIDTATVTFIVSTPQNPPDAANDDFTTKHNAPVSGNVLANDIDPDGDKLFATLAAPPTNGNVVLNQDGSFTYTNNGGFVGTDSFTYTASDGRGGADTAKVEINVTPPAALDASDDQFTRPEDTIIIGSLLANDLDPEGDKFSLISTTAPSSGSLTTNSAGSFTYIPFPNFFGADSFTYTVQDSTGSTDTATVTLTFGAVNDVGAVNDTYSGKENTKLTIAAPGVLANDADPDINPEHKFSILGVIPAAGDGVGGTFDLRGDGSFDFTPALDFSGNASFTYTIGDASGAKATATVTIAIEAANHAPDAKDDSAKVGQDTSENFIAVLTNDTDRDGNAVFVAAVTSPANGTVTIVPGSAQSGGGIHYTPRPGFRGADSFTYVISDGLGGSDNANVTVTVAPPVNPDAADDFFTLTEDTVLLGNLLANDFDLEGDKLTLVSATAPSSGTLITNSEGNFSYTPVSNFVGDASFTYTMTDGNGTSDTASVIVRVTNINDGPDAIDDTSTTDEHKVTINVLANDIDVDLANPVHAKFNTNPPDALRVIAVGVASNGQTALSADGVVSYTPNMLFSGTDSFTYTISDRGQDRIAGTSDDKTDTAKVTVTVFDPLPGVVAVDDSGDGFNVNEDSIRTLLDVLRNDIDTDGDNFKVTAVSQGAKGIVEIGLNGANVLYTPDPNFFGTDTFTYTITDSTGDQDNATVTVTVPNTPDPPDSKNDTAMASTGNNVIDVLANDIDPEGGALKVTAVTQPTGGTVTIGEGGANVIYTPSPGFAGSDLFTYTITDAEGATGTAMVLVTVNTGPGPEFVGSDGDDVFYVRLNSTGTNVQVFDNESGTGTPLFNAPIATAPSLPFDTLGGDDRLIVDAINGNPIPPQGIVLIGGANLTAGDRLSLLNGGNLVVAYTPNGATIGGGLATVSERHISLTGVEQIDASDFSAFTVLTPNASDTLAITRPLPDEIRIAGASGTVTLSPVTLTNISTVIIDAATNDGGGGGDDSLTINAVGDVPTSAGFMEYLCGTGANTLTVQNGSARIDSTVAPGGSLNSTIATGADLITHRLRQNGLVLGDGANVVILQDGTNAATSVVTGLTLGTGATLDINDNALVIDYTGDSPEATVRAKILEGRGGAGIGNGTWTGAGITSSSAAAANAIAPESRSVVFGENASLPLGSYSLFGGVAVDSTSILITDTRTGDASLNGIVDDDDVTIVGAAYNPSGAEPRWAYGDFDMDAAVADDDVTLLGAFYDPSAEPLAPGKGVPAIDDRPAHAAVFAELGGNSGEITISAADLAAISDELFARAATISKRSKLAYGASK